MILALRGDMTVALQGRQQADAVRPARAESALANIYKKLVSLDLTNSRGGAWKLD